MEIHGCPARQNEVNEIDINKIWNPLTGQNEVNEID
jgi:hypothetical protein